MSKASLAFKVLSGDASEIEKKELSDWIAQSKDNSDEFDDLKLLWENSQDPLSEEVSAALAEGWNKIEATVRAKKKRKKRTVLIGVLLLLIGLLTVSIIWSNKYKESNTHLILKFEDTSLQQAILVLEEEYGVSIKLKDSSIGSYRLTCSYEGRGDIDKILQSIDKVLNLSHQSIGDEEYIVSRANAR